MHLYKTQNIKFDFIFDKVKANSAEQICNFIESELKKIGSNKNIKRGLKTENEQKGFSVLNGVLICNANIEGLTSRQTIFIRLEKELSDDNVGQGEPINMVACTLSPARFGVINLRYLSRLTRLFRNKELVDSLKHVDTADGIEILLSDSSPISEALTSDTELSRKTRY